MTNLNRCYGQGYLHYITTSCYQRRPLLALASRRDLFVEVLEHVRRRYHFVVVGYVAMPEHIHLLLCEPERGNPSTVMQAVKQGFARRILGRLRSQAAGGYDGPAENHIWQRRFYDFGEMHGQTGRSPVLKIRHLTLLRCIERPVPPWSSDHTFCRPIGTRP